MDNRTKYIEKVKEGFVGQKMIVLSPDRLLRIEENLFSKNLYPTAIGYYPHAAFHERQRSQGSEQYILLYCVGGKGWIKVSGKELEITANTYYILPKEEAHSYGSSQHDPWSIYWVHFTGPHADLLYARFLTTIKPVPSIPYNKLNVELFNSMFQLLENDLNTRELELLYIKLIQFLGIFVYSEEAILHKESDPVTESIDFMKQNISKSLSVAQLAGQVNYSVSRYSELFKAKTGYSPVQYFLQLKIQASCQYLYFTKMSINDICKKIGFEDQFYFSRTFKKQMNIAPLRYRKKYWL
ncbi:AraC family transcriptional regulator [Mucilaginibacter yixingensis]|uniref:AraC family transcriptional regulator n=1 Tax=Mucilaginibacter yixingensis TaxID=1295612 RepID=A0A2T5J9A2_9SPHI|nr:AraC family transcriptional regulator [Mucilaginibacter yixingensis]PTQ96645.1 AraC family transcriptional regulator [Mucilaginibacter yixingensis]